jgi:hypothetical protein
MTNNKPVIEIKNIPNLYFFHPLSVVVMLLLDWGGFVLEIPQVISPLTLAITFLSIYLTTSIFTYLIQKHFTAESKKVIIIKSLVAGLICAVPTGIMSTIIGSIVLALSGFNSMAIDGLPGLVNMFKKRNAR